MIPLREIDLLGVLVSPFALCIPLAAAGTWGAVAALRRLPAAGRLSHSPLLELALFVGILSSLVLSLGRV
ncbi:MAG: DUF1656 domain-containing protein [Methylobacterium sp.]|uniref:DUF1656 domain-containing protein n=1 Tax=Methylobacterium sp. TaxID=409 RepID=UPI002584E603|nr:DUF1656 domain-containing protein [Methylobacterium sp.]MBY0298266.1 DUF1656 domain-containing protein [Methylobacterium sp.]